VNKPTLGFFDVTLHYPAYLNKPDEQLQNMGNITVPEGTLIDGILLLLIPILLFSLLTEIKRDILLKRKYSVGDMTSD
jgi:hypothetical protein